MPVRSANRSGQAYGFLAMTPIKPGEIEALQQYLESLRERGPSPLSRVSRTHMARWVIVPKFHRKPAYRQRKDDMLEIPSLIFSSNLDGDLDSYLDELCEALAPEAPEIWGRCIGCPPEAKGTALKEYLKFNQVDCGFFYAAYGQATVSKVRRTLEQRDQLVAFAVRSQGLSAEELQGAFVEEFAAS